MQPLELTLIGFRGVRDGLGRDELTIDFGAFAGAQLIAVTGANGRGKTTVLDNAHPYLVMPSDTVPSGAAIGCQRPPRHTCRYASVLRLPLLRMTTCER